MPCLSPGASQRFGGVDARSSFQNAAPAEAGAELLSHVAAELIARNQMNSAKASPRYWLVKFAPFRTPWTEIVKRGRFTLRGVRSAVARKHLSDMRMGDAVLFYHSQQDLAVVGVLEVVREAYADPTSADPQWLTCDFAPVKALSHPVSLEAIKADARLVALALVRQPRLAVMPVTEAEFKIMVATASDRTVQRPKTQ